MEEDLRHVIAALLRPVPGERPPFRCPAWESGACRCDQPGWMRSYADLTGVTELQARSMFIYVCCRETFELDSDGDDVRKRLFAFCDSEPFLRGW